MNKNFWLLLLAAIAFGIIAFFVYPLLGPITMDRITFSSLLALAVTAGASIWLFVTSLKAFKTSTKVAYYIIAAGIFFFAITQLEQLLLTLAGDIDAILLSILVLVPYALTTTTMYIGVRKLARLLGIHYIWTSLWAVIGFSVLVGWACSLIPANFYADPGTKDSAQQLLGIIGATAGFSAAAAIVSIRIRNTISSTYQGAMMWLGIALAGLTFATLHEIVAKGTEIVLTPYVSGGFSAWPFYLACILFMRAAFVFKQAGIKAETLPENATYLDAVVYAAQLVSNPRAIDPTLNKLRQVTASLPKDNQLSDKDKKAIVEVYQQIEEYLVTKEPLRKIAKADLRARLTAEFQAELGKHEQAAPAATPTPPAPTTQPA